MKSLLYILFFLASASMTGQIAPETLPLLNEWKNGAREHGNWNADRIVAKHLGGVEFITEDQMYLRMKTKTKIVPAAITVLDVKTGLFGYVFIQPTIFIQEKYRNSEYLRFIIYHELWHFLGAEIKDHTARGITGVSINDEWNEEEYWKAINDLPKDAYYKKNDNTYY